MITKRLGALTAAVGLALGLSACVDDYGYGGLEVGYGNAGYYGDPYYDGYGYGGYGYGSPSWYGWYGDYYYPGTGIYVYDSYRRPYRWTDSQRRYWSAQQRYRGQGWNGQGNWNGFDRRNDPRAFRDRPWDGRRDGYAPDRSGAGAGGAISPDRPFVPRPNEDRSRWNGRRPGGNRDLTAPGTGAWQGRPPEAGRTFTPPPAGSVEGWRGRGADGQRRFTSPAPGAWQGRAPDPGRTFTPPPRTSGAWEGRGPDAGRSAAPPPARGPRAGEGERGSAGALRRGTTGNQQIE